MKIHASLVRLGAEASFVVAVFNVFAASAAFLTVLTASTVLDVITALGAITVSGVITVPAVMEVNLSLKKFNNFMDKVSLHHYRRGITFLGNHMGQIKLHKIVVRDLY